SSAEGAVKAKVAVVCVVEAAQGGLALCCVALVLAVLPVRAGVFAPTQALTVSSGSIQRVVSRLTTSARRTMDDSRSGATRSTPDSTFGSSCTTPFPLPITPPPGPRRCGRAINRHSTLASDMPLRPIGAPKTQPPYAWLPDTITDWPDPCLVSTAVYCLALPAVVQQGVRSYRAGLRELA